MSIFNVAFTKMGHFFNKTPIFGLHLWIVILFFLLLIISFILLVCSIHIASRRFHHPSKVLHRLKSPKLPNKSLTQEIVQKLGQQEPHREVQIQIGKEEYKVLLQSDRPQSSGESTAPSHKGWLRRYTLRELEAATNGLADAKVIGEGGYGIVYSGVLDDGTLVAVKNLSNNRGHAEKEFTVEIAVIGRVKHKNLVRLLGYCVEGDYRMLVYEYVDNGNLQQWLHRDVKVSPLTWNMRLNIILGTAKGLAYLHESLEPKVVHRDLKSCNILLDREWNPKVSDFGMAKLLSSDSSHVTTRVMGTFGYVAPEYATTNILNEKSDVYSFGVLTMEIISGRSPIDYGRPEGEENLVEWMRTMIGNRRSEEVVDPKLPDAPPPKALKHILLVALLCVDPAASERPKMGQLIHMLEAVDLQVQHEATHGDYQNQR